MLTLRRWIGPGCVALAMLAACGQAPAPAPAHDRSPERHGKPVAAVEVTIEAVDLGGGDYEVTLRATPTADVTALELQLDDRRLAAGASAAGAVASLRTVVHVEPGKGRDVIGGAVVIEGGRRRNRAAVVRVGAPEVAPPQRTQIITLPDGSEVHEVRP